MPSRPATAAVRRLAVTVVVAVVVMLLAPVAGLTSTTAGSTAPAAAVTSGTHAEAVTAQGARKAGRASKARKAKKTRKARGRAAAARVPAASVAWSGSTLRYYDGLPAQWRWSLDAAVANWNQSGAGLTLVPVSSPAQAQVKISYGSIGTSSGLATVGRASDAFVKLSDRYRSLDASDPYYRVEVMGVLTHELGHVLGLEHVSTGCALMGPVMDIVGCGIYDMQRPQDYRCDVVGAAATQQAVRLYGGAARQRASAECALPAA